MSEPNNRLPSWQRELSLFSFTLPAWVLGLVAVALFGNLLGWLGLGLLPDEAYYWVWSQRLQWGYFDHPPLIAWMMLPGAWLFDDAAWAVRLPAVASWLVGALLAYRMGQQIFGGRAGPLALLAWASLPMMQAGFHIVTPDSALMIFTWLALWSAWRAGQAPGAKWWLTTGLYIGLALQAKYTAVLLLGALFFALLGSRDGRRWLATPWPWLGSLLAILVFMPVVVWNGLNEWISFRFQFGHGVKSQVANDTLEMFLLFLGGQLAVAMPWSFLAMAWSPFSRAARELDGYTRALLGWNFWLPMLVFGAAGLTSEGHANWPVSAYAAGTVLLGGLLDGLLYRGGQLLRGRALLVMVLFLLPQLVLNFMRFPHTLMGLLGGEVPPQRTQLSQAYGWGPVALALREQLALLPNGSTCHILVDNHARAGMVAWLLRLPQRVESTLDTRTNQYTLWRAQGGVGEDYCLYLEQFDAQRGLSDEMIPSRRELPEGQFERMGVIEARNPDGSHRWFGLYRATAK